jgi:hypothetical protein
MLIFYIGLACYLSCSVKAPHLTPYIKDDGDDEVRCEVAGGSGAELSQYFNYYFVIHYN